MAKYLDESGVQTLWTAVKKADTTIKNSLETKIGGLTLEYSVDSKEIHLKGSDGTVQSTIDVTSFVKDGMLKSVTVLTASLDSPVSYKGKTYSNGEKFLRFEWNADSDDVELKVNILKMDEIAPVYSGSSSIDIDVDNKLHVKEVGTTLTKTTASIPVAGGPLADLLNNAGITEINEGTDIQSLLFQLLCKVLWPEDPKFNDGSISVSISKPSFTLGSENTTVEVGTKVIAGTTTISTATMSTTNRGWVDVDYGYATELNGEKVNSTSINATIKTDAALSADNYTLSRTYSGFVNAASKNETAEASTTAASVQLNPVEVMVAEGECTVTATVGGPSASITFNATPQYCACSNTGETSNEHILEAKAEATKTSAKATNSVTKKVTGARYSYVGAVAGNFQATSAGVRELTKKANSKSATNSVTAGANMTQVIIAFPTSWGSLKQVKDNNSLGAVITDNFVLTDNVMVEGANGYTAAAYKVYVYTSDVRLGAIDYTVTIS